MGNIEDPGIVIVVVVIGVILVIILGRAFFRLIGRAAGGKSREQLEIDRRAFSQADFDERWHEMGKTASQAKKKGGCVGWLIIIGIIIVAVLALLSQMQR